MKLLTEIKLYSGAVHYFRIPKQYWRNRLEYVKVLTFNFDLLIHFNVGGRTQLRGNLYAMESP